MKKIYLILIVSLGFIQSIWADDAGQNFAKALQAQTNGNSVKAIELYESILSEGQLSSELYNNLGLAYIQTKQLGKGILSFERALKINNNNQDAGHNLAAAEQRIVEPIESPPSVFFVRWWLAIVGSLSSTMWGILFLFFFSVGIGGFAASRWQGVAKYKKLGIAMLIFSLLPLLWGFQQKGMEQDDSYAIITKKQVGVRQEPELNSPEIELIKEGVKVKILEQKESWVYVQLPNHLVGWMPVQMLEKI